MTGFYYIFWFIMSLLAAVLAATAFVYLMILLNKIKDSLIRIEDNINKLNNSSPKSKSKK